MSAKSWATNTSTKILATQCFDGATLGTNQTYRWSCHSTNATLGTLKPTVSSDDMSVSLTAVPVSRGGAGAAPRCWPQRPTWAVVGGEEVVGQLLHWTSLRYIVPTGVPHVSVSLFSRPYSSVSAPRCALGLSLCRPSETTYCLFEPFKYNHVAFAYFSFLSNPLVHRSCRPPVESILPHASFEHSAEYHSHVPTLVLFQ